MDKLKGFKILFSVFLFVYLLLFFKVDQVQAVSCARCSDTYWGTWSAWTESTGGNCTRNPAYNPTAPVYTCNSSCTSGASDYGTCSQVNCNLPWGGTTAYGNTPIAYSSSAPACGINCSNIYMLRTCGLRGVLSGSGNYGSCTDKCCASGGCPQTTSGGSCTTYSSSSVACGSSCTSIDRLSNCTDGTWSTTPYSYSSCSVGSCNCTGTPWGTVSSGYSNTAYSTATVACGSSCTSVDQIRTCTNGTMSGTYTNTSCSVGACASCTGTPWGTVAHGYSNTAYSSASPTCGTACASETRTCTNGTMSGSYTNTSCTAKCCASGACPQTNYGGAVCTSNSTATVACGSSCPANTSSTCQSNGIWSVTPAANASCSVTGCLSCTLPWGGQITNGQSVTAYSSASPACGTACASETRTCNGVTGVLSGSYTNQSCSACCNNPWGSGTTAGGSSITAYAAASTTCPAACDGETRTCSASTGTWTGGSHTFQSCTPGTCASCTNPFGGAPIAHGASVTAYSTSSVACGSSCVSETRTCNNGTLSGSYTNAECEADCPCAFPATGSKTITTSCGFGATANKVDGVDAGTGASNSGILTIDNGATITIGGANNQTLTYGQINLVNGSIVIAKGLDGNGVPINAQLKKSPIWVSDADGDGYSSSATPTLVASTTQPSGKIRRSVVNITTDGNSYSYKVDCDDTNPGPCAATSPSATAISATQIDLSWTAPSTSIGPAATNYDIYYCTGTSCTPTLGPINNAGTTYSHTSLSGSTVYGYKIVSKNAAGSATATSNFYATTQAACTNGYTDYDKDGYGTGSYGCYAASGSYNVVANNTDCNDANANVYQLKTVAKDADADGYAIAALASTCVGASNANAVYLGTDGLYNWYTSRTGYFDCDDATVSVYQNVASTAYDDDQDGYAAGFSGEPTAPATHCTGNSTVVSGRTYYKDAWGNYDWLLNPLGNSDCAYTDNTKWQTLTCPTSTTYSTNGTYSYIVPTGVSSVDVECWGGGGGGINGMAGTSPFIGGGGGGGAYVKGTISVTPGNSYTTVVGAGGAVGGNGGNSYFINDTTLAARGGKKGVVNGQGKGGESGNSVGTIKYSGGNGSGNGYSDRGSSDGGCGGSSAGTSTNGVSHLGYYTPATAPTGAGNGGRGGRYQLGPATAGGIPGGGGGGGGYTTSSNGYLGAAGANGKCIITPAGSPVCTGAACP